MSHYMSDEAIRAELDYRHERMLALRGHPRQVRTAREEPGRRRRFLGSGRLGRFFGGRYGLVR